MIAVIDTNVLLRMAAAHERSPLFVAWYAKRFIMVLSEPMLQELTQVAARPKTRRFLPPLRFDRFVSLVRSRSVMVTPAAEFPHCRDPQDDIVIATAVAARASVIVTSDGDLYDDPQLVARLKDEWHIQIVQPFEFLAPLC